MASESFRVLIRLTESFATGQIQGLEREKRKHLRLVNISRIKSLSNSVN